jgi:hypothetical protein
MSHWEESINDDDDSIPSPMDIQMETKGYSHCVNFDTPKESCYVKAASECGLSISIQSEAYNRAGMPIGSNGKVMKALYIPIDTPESTMTRFWESFNKLEAILDRETELYKSTTLVQCPNFKGQRASLFVDYHRWQYTTCTIQRRVYEELSLTGETQVPDTLVNIVLARLEYGGFLSPKARIKS